MGHIMTLVRKLYFFLMLSMMCILLRTMTKHEIVPHKKCDILTRIDANCKKLQIYLPNYFGREFNKIFEIQNNDVKCSNFLSTVNFGHGLLRHANEYFGQFETDQFSTDLIFYNRIAHDIDTLVDSIGEANVIYIPFMVGLACTRFRFMMGNSSVFKDLYKKVAMWIDANEREIQNKTIFMIYSRVESDFFKEKYCRLYGETLRTLRKYNLHIFGIEDYANRTLNYKFSSIPYATFTKFLFKPNKFEYNIDFDGNRDIDLLFVGNARGNAYRKSIVEAISVHTSLSYEEFKRNNNSTQIHLTVSKCKIADSLIMTYNWKIHTKFCFEPYGDTPTRRSFWDSIMLGCIPVIFTRINLPFSNYIDYSQFVLTFNLTRLLDIKRKKAKLDDLIKPYLHNSTWLSNARSYIEHVRQFLQYTWMYDKNGNIIEDSFKYDAYGMILAELAENL